ncbi:telomere length regulator protein [Colletotrichum truncatum]|uniref:Telomere length regulator protein n=1 Tax=Colletotrichum truncatum TaxID=5467 RepID=A0ACC3YUC4_COLTU|nr:telomere length regulator protein [Colletotrichum truncatum]KAF6785115.1 telomere length regulator protein [Colletotrichum truncatum]
MGSVEVVSSRLESLPPRPPTPPRETNQAVDATSKHLLVLPPSSDPRSSLHTPPNVHSPLSGADSTNPSVRRTRKRVGFSAKAQYNEAPKYAAQNSLNKRSPLSVPSSTQPKPVKGILKQPSSPSPLHTSVEADTLATPANISDMLESTVKQLAGADRDSKRDAYSTLVMTLKTSNNLPDRIALQSKMGLFVQFIQRDITSKSLTTGGPDVPLVNNALSLLATFLHFPAIASTIPSDFGVFFLDHCIRSFEDSSTPKDVTRHLMHAVATQDFPTKVMTSDRVRRLVAALRKIEEHLKGKSIVMSRIMIYRRLVQQTKQLMAVHSDWLNDLLTDMLSTVKDLRSAAISLGFEAVYTFGKEKMLSRKVMELFDTSIEEMKFAEYYHRRLFTMAKDKEDRQLTAAVPKIWSVIVLFLRCPLDRWQFFNQWLQLIQMSFNNNDHPQTKQEANFAWNRFVWSMHTEGQSFVKLLPTLYQPLGSQLKSKYTSKHIREVVFGSVCNLLYYTFKPGTNPVLLDTYWDACVRPIIEPPKAAARNPEVVDEHLRQATLVLIGLFDSATPRIWREERIRETTLARPEELPSIDPKWLRRNAASVFQVIEPIMERHFLELADKKSQVHRLWRTLVAAVASAASKEIKVSVDTTSFISQMCGLLLKHWETGLSEMKGTDSETAARFLRSARELISVTVEALGLLPFTEKMISLGRFHTFTPVSTPSHKPAKNSGDARTPLHHLFGLVSVLPPGIPDGEDFVDFFRTVFSPFFTSKPPRSRSELAQEMLSVAPSWSSPASHKPYAPWVFASECLAATFNMSQNSAQTTSSTGEPTVGHEYRSVVRLLERGWRETPNLPWQNWCSLYSLLSNRSSEETGEAGRALGAIEPLAKVIRESLPADRTVSIPAKTIIATSELLSVASHPLDRQAVEAARRRLWGTAVTGPRSSSFDPFDTLYKLTNDLLERLYEAGERGDLDESVATFIKETSGFLSRCNSELVPRTIATLENGLVLWIRDSQGILKTRQSPAPSEAVKTLWDVVSKIALSGSRPEEIQLDTYEELICAAFESKHRHIINSVSEMWNSIFGNAESIQYPDHLKAVLLSVQSLVDITLPGLETIGAPTTGQNRSFIDSQNDIDMLSAGSTRSSRKRLQPRSIQSSPLNSVKKSSANRRVDNSSKKTRSRGRRSAPTARLRHDDSQIQFAPIEKSPLNSDADVESQALTERQKEIRERQKDTSAMFPEMRSSPALQLEAHEPQKPKTVSDKDPETPQDATPKRSQRYEDFVSSTPTPRRGQAVAMVDHDQDMTDPPSSPPEPRPFPLLTQIKSRSSSRSEVEDWQFSSSPVSGSPPAEPSAPPNEPTELDLSNGITSKHGSRQASHDLGSGGDTSMQTVRSSAVVEPELPPPALETTKEAQRPEQTTAESESAPKSGNAPSTPRNNRTTDREEPRSGQEVFVDAPSSPAPNVLTRSASRNAANRSFDMSEGDESSMLKLVVELDRRRCDLPINDYPAISPPKANKASRSAKKKAVVLDCITVGGDDEEEEEDEEEVKEAVDENETTELAQRQTRSRKSNSRFPATTSTPVAGSAASSPDKSDKKRKRDSSKYDTRRKKRQSIDNAEETALSQLEASQMSPVLGEEVSQQSLHVLHDTPSRRSTGSRSEDYEAELQSQVVTELQEADSRESQSQESVPADNVALEDSMDVDLIDQPNGFAQVPTKDANMLESLGTILANLRSASLSRDEVYKMEDMLMDIKHELFAAEKRGRS